MATPSDLAQIWQWNELVPTCLDKCVHEIIQERVETQPSSPAVCAWDGTLTYAELGQLATNLAHRLVSHGVGPNSHSIVPLCFEKSMWTAVAMLGILKAGAGFVLIDPQQPEHRLRTIVKQIEANVIVSSITMSELSLRLIQTSITLSWQLFESPFDTTDVPLPMPDPVSVLYVAFTSGSTGEPKGALISHRNISSALAHQDQPMGLTAKTRFYDFSSYSFDASIGIFFTTLAAGGCICVPSESDRHDNLIESIRALGANTIDLTPSVAALLSPALVPSLDTLILGGEALQVRDVNRWWGSVRVMSFYGPCECTPTSTINYDANAPEDAIHLGKGAGLVTWLVSPEDHHTLIPIDAVGELLLEGPLVGLGYLHNPEQTAKSFIEDPVWLLRGAAGRQGRHGRLYKTGDLARYRSDGSLMFVGRKDTQTKVRGQRVELREIEITLRGHTGVDDAVAVVHKDPHHGGEWITAFVTVQDEGDAFLRWSPLKKWQERIAKDTTSIDVGTCVTSGRDFTSWKLIRNANVTDSNHLNRWLTSTIDPMTSNTEEGKVLGNRSDSPFVLFSMPKTDFTITADLAPYTDAVKFVSKMIDSLPAVEKIIDVLKASPADLGSEHLALSPGLVVMNSVVHFFPSQAYLLNVVREALNLDGVRTIVFGHVHSTISWRESLAESATRLFQDCISNDGLRDITEVRLDEFELLVNPTFFTSLLERMQAKVAHVEIIPNETDDENRLGSCCYTAVIHVSSEDAQLYVQEVDQAEWIDFENEVLDRQELFSLLQKSSAPKILPVTNIPYSSIVHGYRSLQRLQNGEEKALNRAHVEKRESSLSVRDLVGLAKSTGHRVQVSWVGQSSQRGALTAVFYQHYPADDQRRALFHFPSTTNQEISLDILCSKPKYQEMEDKVEAELLEMLHSRLSSYMIPGVIRVLDKMPLNNNCKIDRRALEGNIQRRKRQDLSISENKTLSKAEDEVRRIWGNALRIEPTLIGRNDRFFDIGGDSISAMKVVLGARGHGIGITVRDVFFLEVHEMAERISPLSAS